MKNLSLVLLLAVWLFSGCDKEESDSSFKGAEQTLGNGKAYSWVKFSADDKPASIGFTLTKGALDNLAHTGVALVLSFPAKLPGKSLLTTLCLITYILDMNHQGCTM